MKTTKQKPVPQKALEDMDDDELSAALKHAKCERCGATQGTFVSLTLCWSCDRESNTTTA